MSVQIKQFPIVPVKSKRFRSASIGNMQVSMSETSSKSKQDDVDIDTSSSGEKKPPHEAVPVQPPPAKLISNFAPDNSPKKTRRKSEKARSRKNSARSSAEGSIEPAPQLLFGAGEADGSEKKKKKRKSPRDPSKVSSKKKVRKSKKSQPADAQSFVPAMMARSTERFDDSKSVFVKRNLAISSSNTGRKPPIPSDGKGVLGLAKSQFVFEQQPQPQPQKNTKSKAVDTMDDPYVTILTIPTEVPERVNRKPAAYNEIPKPLSFKKQTSSSSRLPVPVLPSVSSKGDGLMPIETLAETTDLSTNAFREDKYDRSRFKAPKLPQVDMTSPVAGWLKFQVPIVPKPDDVEYERQATKQFDIARLLHQAKSC